VEEAQKYLAKGRPDRAITEYQKLVQANPNDDRSMLKIAELQTRMGAFEEAVKTYERVGAYYAAEGFSAKAAAVYGRIRAVILQHAPDLPGHYGPTVSKLAALYQKSGLLGDAIATYREYAAHLEHAGRDQELLGVYRKLVELKPDNIDARQRLVQELRRHAETAEADATQQATAELLVQAGRRDEALRLLDELLPRNQEPALVRRVANMYLDRAAPGDAMVALTRMQACFQSAQRDMDTLRVLVRAFEAIGQRPKAVEVRKLMVRIARDNGDTEAAAALLAQLQAALPAEAGVRKLPRPAMQSEDVDIGGPEHTVPSNVQRASPQLQPRPAIPRSGPGPAARPQPADPAPPPRPARRLPFTPPPGFSAPPAEPAGPKPVIRAVHIPAQRDAEALEELSGSYTSLDDDLGDLSPPGRQVSRPDEPLPTYDTFSSAPPAIELDDPVEGLVDSSPAPAAAPAMTAVSEDGDVLGEALDEIDFFLSQELYEDALLSIEELIPRFPGHPMLIARLRTIRQAKAAGR
jgi:tetratricopeptide (TPR) repeat protein